MASIRPHDGPRMAKIVSRWPSNLLKWPNMPSSCPQDGAKVAQDVPKMASRWRRENQYNLKEIPKAPRWPQDGPKRAPRRSRKGDLVSLSISTKLLQKLCFFPGRRGFQDHWHHRVVAELQFSQAFGIESHLPGPKKPYKHAAIVRRPGFLQQIRQRSG